MSLTRNEDDWHSLLMMWITSIDGRLFSFGHGGQGFVSPSIGCSPCRAPLSALVLLGPFSGPWGKGAFWVMWLLCPVLHRGGDEPLYRNARFSSLREFGELAQQQSVVHLSFARLLQSLLHKLILVAVFHVCITSGWLLAAQRVPHGHGGTRLISAAVAEIQMKM